MKTYLWFGLVLMTAITVLAQTNTVPIPGATDAVPNVELSKLLLFVVGAVMGAASIGVREVGHQIAKCNVSPA